MKYPFKYVINFLILFFIPFILFCQPNIKNSTEAYNYWVLRGIIEIVYSSMEDYSKPLTEAEQKGKEQYYEKYIEGIDKKDFSEIERSFNEIEQFLNRNSYSKTADGFLQPLKSNYKERKPLNDQFLVVPNNYDNPQKWNEKKYELLKKYQNSLDNIAASKEFTKGKEEKTDLVPLEHNNKEIVSGWISIILVFFIGFILGGFLVYQYSKSKIYSILETEKKPYFNILNKDQGQKLLLKKCFKYIGIVEVLKLRKNNKQDEIDGMKEAIALLKEQNEKLNAGGKQIEKVLVKQIVVEDNPELVSDHLDEKPSTLSEVSINKIEIFFTIPENDGSFKTENARNVQGIDCYYKIELDNSGQKGKLSFISGNYDLRALDNIDYYLNPVCEIQNITDRTFAKKIVMTDPGSATKRGDYWKIEDTNKVKIKLV